jgi:NADP-dependent 3-hydroxy acid dehydrogenase YdfG
MIEPDDMADAVEYLLTHRTDAVVDEIRIHRSTKAPF